MRGTPAERFAAKTIPGPAGCILWNAGGTFYVDGKLVKPPRAAWLIHRGPIESRSLGVFATCGRDQCVNPAHLELTTLGPKPLPLSERLAAMTDRSAGPTGCWPFTGSRSRFGYGQIMDEDGSMIAAHRAAWKVTKGPIPAGVVIRHRCDNPPCCNPRHLESGAQADNIDDMYARGRARKANRDTGHPRAKLTSAQVEEIRARHVPFKVTYKMLAAEYGVSYSTVQNLVLGRRA